MRPSTRARPPAPLLRAHLSPLGACIALGLSLVANLAQAQTAPRYTARDLPKPTAALYCVSSASLTEAGDVGQTCTYSGGSYTTPVQVCYEYLGFCYTTRNTVKVSYTLPAVWPANGGSVKPLTTSVLSSVWQATLTRSGAMVGRGSPITTKGVSIGNGQSWTWLPPYGSAGQTLNPPAALVGEYALNGVTRNGALWWRTPDGRTDAVATPDGQVKPEPLVPAPPNPGETVTEDLLLAIQDGDMAVRRRWMYAETNGVPAYRSENWFRRGQQWTRIPMPADQPALDGVTIASDGRVLLRHPQAVYTWRAEQAGTLTLVGETGGNGNGARLINASGLVAGSAPTLDSRGRSKASIWWQGQQLDLQGLVNSGLPAKTWALRTVEAINDRGQLVVNVEDTSKTGNASLKTVLLTPQ
jgi:hypothetical protein